MNIFDIDLKEDFLESFTSAGTPVVECDCGREHVCINSDYFKSDFEINYEEYEADYREKARTNEKVILCEEYDSIRVIEINGRYFAEDCECQGWKPYMNFILQYRSQIKEFLIRTSAQANRALEHEKTFNVLNDKEHDVLDRGNY